MTNTEETQHHRSQWAPTPVAIRTYLSEKSLNSKSRFYSYISQEGGFTIPAPCFFTTTSKGNKTFRVQVSLPEKAQKEINEKSSLSFHVISPLEDIWVVCSKLNMASALGCKIVAHLEEKEVVFTISSPGQLAEKKLIKNFELFDMARDLRWKKNRF